MGSRLRSFAWVNPFWNLKTQNFSSVATVTWMVGYSNFWYQYDRIYIFFHRTSMESDFQSSRLVNDDIPIIITNHWYDTSRREILCWIRIWSQNLNSTYENGLKINFEILRERIQKNFTPLKLWGHFMSLPRDIEIKINILWETVIRVCFF